ncbi:MAG: flagellar basal body rod protein FlgB [Rhodobiaceae bacterium]|jgi:flagellar basal-body rod protein FlgB|nr:flagellar basal body rod protein FlgB [Rhodobiaceae bacterium]MCR9242903.1 flagellar basal body rod protein FlgB [Rhodobiaceae bacterium]
MFLGDSPIFSMMKERMHWLSDRQRVIAENVANADTPNYIAKDLSEPDFGAMLRSRSSRPVLTATRTDGDHMSANGSTGGSSAAYVRSPDFETTPTGNSVVLEEQMIKAAQNQMDYQTVTGLYAKSVGMLKIALGKG